MAEINDLNVTDASNTARFPENQLPSTVNNGARALEGIIARWDKDTNASLSAGGSANAITISANQTLSAYYDGLVIAFEAGATNTGAVTINVDSVGVKSLKKNVTEDISVGEIISGQKVIAIYDGTNFQIVSAFSDTTETSLAAEWASKTDGIVASSDYSSKAYAIGGTGVTDTAGKGAAKEWATAAEDDLVDGSEYSAKHYSIKSNASAVASAASAVTAAASETAAAASETAAGVSETNAAASAATALAATIGKYGAHIDIAFADSPYTVGTLTEDTLITVNTSGGNVVINLPQSTGEDDNRLIGINKNGATNTITINPFAGDTVGGGASFVQYDDTEWADFYLDKSALNWQLGNLSFTAAGTGLTKTGSTISTDFASIAEVSAGTSAAKSVNPDALAGSIFGTAVVPLIPFDSATACAVGNGAGSLLFRVPSTLNGMNLVGVAAAVGTAGTTGTMDIQIANVTQAADMLTTKITIDSAETDSSTAATPAVIDAANDDVATGDQLRIDVDAIHTTPATGLMVELQFRLP